MGSSNRSQLLGEIAFGTAHSSDTDFFGSDIVIPALGGYGKKCVIQGVFATSQILLITVNGDDYISGGSKETLWQIELYVYEGDTLNFKVGAGVTTNFFRVDLLD